MQPPTPDQLQRIDDLVLTRCETVAQHSAIRLENMRMRRLTLYLSMRWLTSVCLTEITSASQASVLISALEADASRSDHIFKACG